MEKHNEFHTDISQNGTRFRLTFITNDKNNFLAMQDLARKCIDGKDIVDNIFGELESVMRIVKYPRTLPNGKIRVETIRGYMIMHEDYETIKKKYRDMIRKEADDGKA